VLLEMSREGVGIEFHGAKASMTGNTVPRTRSPGGPSSKAVFNITGALMIAHFPGQFQASCPPDAHRLRLFVPRQVAPPP
jgi:hypothetical protein